MTVEQIKKSIEGEWISIAPELRPSNIKAADGTIKPFYLTRHFTYLPDDKFELDIVNFIDAYGKTPLTKLSLTGRVIWQGEHPIIANAQKVKFIADQSYTVTPLIAEFADTLNKIAVKGYSKWEVGIPNSILKKSFIPFGLADGQIFTEFDLIYELNGFLFWGARNVDGRGFDTEENRPTNLQIPLARKKINK